MKIGTCMIEHSTATDREIYKKFKEIGYDAIDYPIYKSSKTPRAVFSQGEDAWRNFFKEEKEYLDSLGLTVSQTHATYPTNYDGNRFLSDELLAQFKKEIEACAILGGKYIVIHPIKFAVNEIEKEENTRVNFEWMAKLVPTLEKFDVYLAVENMFIWDGVRDQHTATSCTTPEDMIYYIDTLNSTLKTDRFVACLDLGHMFIARVNPGTAIRKLGDRLKILHVHDNYGMKDNHNMITNGKIDWKDVALSLKEIGYQGIFNLEPDFSNQLRLSLECAYEYSQFGYNRAKEVVSMIEKA